MASRNVYPVMRVAVTGTAEVNAKLGLLSVAIRRRITRYAITAAARPMVAAAKTVAKAVAAQSKRHEGFGTTARAMSVKVASSKKNPDVSYAIIGADRHYVELFDLQAPFKRSGVINVRFIKRGKGGVMKAPKRIAGMKTWSARNRNARLSPTRGKDKRLTGGAVRRRPANYAHLLEYGTRRSAAHPIIARASQARYQSAAAFKTRFMEGLNREIAKLAAQGAKAA